MSVDKDSGVIFKHGTFTDVEASLDALRREGTTSIYVVGALERDNGWGDGDDAVQSSDDTSTLPGFASGGAVKESDGEESDGRCGGWLWEVQRLALLRAFVAGSCCRVSVAELSL